VQHTLRFTCSRNAEGLFGTQLGVPRSAISQGLQQVGIPWDHFLVHIREIRMRADDIAGDARVTGFVQTAGTRMQKEFLVSIVEDDQFFRESMKRLMRSQGYSVEAFSSAADFLVSPRLVETACLIADVHMPAMTGIELYRQLIEAGYAIPTILVTAYPNDADRDRALKDGAVGYLRKPVDDKHLLRCLRAALHSNEPPDENS
jgi:CheY-like chemotaxis protein